VSLCAGRGNTFKKRQPKQACDSREAIGVVEGWGICGDLLENDASGDILSKRPGGAGKTGKRRDFSALQVCLANRIREKGGFVEFLPREPRARTVHDADRHPDRITISKPMLGKQRKSRRVIVWHSAEEAFHSAQTARKREKSP